MLVNGELGYELDTASLCMLEIPLPPSLPGCYPEVERDDKLSLLGAGPTETNKRDGQPRILCFCSSYRLFIETFAVQWQSATTYWWSELNSPCSFGGGVFSSI